MNPQIILAVISLLDHLALGLRLGPKAKTEYDLLSSSVRNMVDNQRDPTDAEWQDLGRKITKASSRLQAASALLDE